MNRFPVKASSVKKNTKLIEAGRDPKYTMGVVNPPVFHASTHLFETYADLRAGVADMEAGLFYGRKGAWTHKSLEAAMLELEPGAAGCKAYSSGMAAITSALIGLTRSGDHILMIDNVYEPSRAICDKLLKQHGVETTYYDPMIGAGIADLMQDNTTVVFVETPGSLTFEVPDLPAIAKAAHENGAFVILDNTWATPYFLNGFEHGADVVCHAATKYIVGHSDAMMGTAAANERAWKRLLSSTYQLGHVAGPDDVFLALRGLRTLGVRLERHQRSAMQVAEWLQARDDVDRVFYPALENCPGHDVWKRDFSGASGLLSFTLKAGDYPDTAHIVDEIKLFGMGFSWGGYESLILPSDPARIRTIVPWNAPGPLLRLHIGLEDVDDLLDELDAGLARYAAAVD